MAFYTIQKSKLSNGEIRYKTNVIVKESRKVIYNKSGHLTGKP